MNDLFDQPSRPVIICISLWQPWASLWAAGFKPDETRHWPTKVRGEVAVHAAKRIDVAGAPHELCAFAFGSGWARSLPAGGVLGIGLLTGCFRAEDVRADIDECNALAGNFGDGRFAHRYSQVRPLIAPIPLKGLQGFFRWQAPGDIYDRLLPEVDFKAQAAAWTHRKAA